MADSSMLVFSSLSPGQIQVVQCKEHRTQHPKILALQNGAVWLGLPIELRTLFISLNSVAIKPVHCLTPKCQKSSIMVIW